MHTITPRTVIIAGAAQALVCALTDALWLNGHWVALLDATCTTWETRSPVATKVADRGIS
tara:strand:- start:323 stop:502 length:180 start_codon:yes stop_codon:yes gene_type:complete